MRKLHFNIQGHCDAARLVLAGGVVDVMKTAVQNTIQFPLLSVAKIHRWGTSHSRLVLRADCWEGCLGNLAETPLHWQGLRSKSQF